MADHEPDWSRILFRPLLRGSAACGEGRAPAPAAKQHQQTRSVDGRFSRALTVPCGDQQPILRGTLKMTTTTEPKNDGMAELALYFLRLGCLGFGGPVALVGQMERELVTDKKWLTKEQMRESIAICQSLPGPLAIQVGVYISYVRAGFWGAWAGGWAFILPNFVIVAALGA